MIELYRWLGDLNGINTLSLFEINPQDYFPLGSDRNTETKRLEADIKNNYRQLMFKLHPDRLQQFPESFKELSEEFYKKVNNLYDLLTNAEKYTNPDPDDGKHNLPGVVSTTLETFTLTNYVLSLRVNQPDELPLVGIIKKFIKARDDLEQILTQKKSFIISLPPREPLSPTEYVQLIDERDNLISSKKAEIEKLNQEIERQREIIVAYRKQLGQAVEDRHRDTDLLLQIDKKLEETLGM